MKKNIVILSIIICTTITLIGCIKKTSVREQIYTDDKVTYNDIFTEELHDDLTEIDYWSAGKKIVITNKEDMETIYNAFASLKLKEFSPKKGEEKVGHISINIVTKNSDLGIGLLAGEITVNNKSYYIDKDIVDEVRNIAMKNEVE